MKLKFLAASLLLLGLSTTPVAAADSPQFRGPNRDGIFSAKGLVKFWPKDGPKLLWSTSGLGDSYASTTVVGGRLFSTGKHGHNGTVFALDLEGKKLWSTVYGTEHSGAGYPGTRTTPTYDDGTLFLLSSNGEAVALDAASGEIRWKVNVLRRYAGVNIAWGMSESPLVDGDRVIITPGGRDASIVALDRKTGETVWTSKGLSDTSAYCSPRIWETGKHRQLVTMTGKHLVGLDPETGRVLWRTGVTASHDIHSNSPVFNGDLVYVSHHKQGTQAFRLAADGRSVTQIWRQRELDIQHGGAVLTDGRIYGAALTRGWYAIDATSGDVLGSIPRLRKGSIVYADGLLYGYTESGYMLLIDPDSFKLISHFPITAGEGHHWSHPVIVDQVLYIRHGSVLMAYDIAAAG